MIDVGGNLRCLLDRHKPGHGKVEWDGRNFVSTCARCEKQIRRHSKGVWRRDGA